MADMMREDIRLCRYDNIYDRLGRMIRTSEIATNKLKRQVSHEKLRQIKIIK